MSDRNDRAPRRHDELALTAERATELGLELPHGRVRRLEWDVAGRRISALRWGTEEPELVLLHGGSLNAHAWDAMLLGWPVSALAIDLPGHGHSSWYDEPLYLPEQLADVLAPIVAEVAPRAAAVVGHSLGGLTALAMAAHHPDVVGRLVLVDATPGSTPDRSAEIVEFVSTGDFRSFEAMLDHTVAYRPDRQRSSLRRSLLLNARERADGRWTWRHDVRDPPDFDRWGRIFDALPRGWEHADAVRCPTLLVRGGRSRIVLDSDVERYTRLIEDLQVAVVPEAGHNIHGDQPAALARAIGGFVDTTTTGNTTDATATTATATNATATSETTTRS